MTNKIPRKTLKELRRILKIIILEKQEIDCMASSLHTQMNYISEKTRRYLLYITISRNGWTLLVSRGA